MKIRELLEAVEPKKSNLPTAPSLNDREDDSDEEENQEEDEFLEGVDQFKKLASEFGPDLYAFSSITYNSGWDAKNSTPLAAKLESVDLPDMSRVASEMRSSSGRNGGMTFVIVNGRSGEVVIAGFGEDAISDGIQMDTLETDQTSIVNRLNSLSSKYARVGGGVDEETNIANRIRNQILVLLEYGSQPVKDIDPEADAARAEYEKNSAAKDADWQQFKSSDTFASMLKRREARRAAKRSGAAGREKR